ncbi:DUF1775 domain-containing protein [Rubrobacter tropicus]|uniref:DUF1775 domain-containing protein n=1 Tax=Rubrobacter tropicus TaxID=2653851 RepID=A0A6G8Q4W4_9ACTN|nr:DUF1775 domain-containing protein [Rubrobacter tropicus]QIN81367.1 DUF1775 domain-containing protein [Rubrobacter tropicus]
MRKTGLRVVLLSVLLTFGLAGAALAHVEVSPDQVPAGATETFTIEVPTEKEIPTTEVRIELPEGFEAGGAEAPSGWRGEVQGNALVWTGGEIPVANSEEFSFEATVPDEAGSFRLSAIQTYEDGSVAEWTGAPDSEEPAPVIEVASGGGASGEMDEPQHGDTQGSHEEVPDTGGVNAGLLLGVCVAVFAAASLLLRSAVR